MAEISKESHGLKDLMCPDIVSTEVDVNAPGVEMIKSLCYFCHASCGVLAYVKDGDVIKIKGDPAYSTSIIPPASTTCSSAAARRARASGSRSRTIRASRRSLTA